VLIDFLRERPETVWRVGNLQTSGDVPYTCSIVVEEVVRGLKPTEEQRAQLLFDGLRVAPLLAREGWVAGEWRRKYAKQGKTLAQSDCLIAAAAFSIGARVGTGNPKDFPMPEVEVEHWPVGA
jgi:predicted nucleic acid-binding protein